MQKEQSRVIKSGKDSGREARLMQWEQSRVFRFGNDSGREASL